MQNFFSLAVLQNAEWRIPKTHTGSECLLLNKNCERRKLLEVVAHIH